MKKYVDEFLQRYPREYDLYARVSQLASEVCEKALERNGVRAIVTYRAKRTDRLRDKVAARDKKRKYRSVKAVYRDIVDLAGVRVALYFPGDIHEVTKLIDEAFVVKLTKDFPQPKSAASAPKLYKKVFSGYGARHFRVFLRPTAVPTGDERYCDVPVEIQVASVLMHGWAEVEHDLAYKPISGELSQPEQIILDEVNGIVLSGELALQRLQEAVAERTKAADRQFENHYELAAYIHKKTLKWKTKLPLGAVDVLFAFLKEISRNTPAHVIKYLETMPGDTEARTFSEQIVDQIVQQNGKLYGIYSTVRDRVSDGSRADGLSQPSEQGEADLAAGRFLQAWIRLERTLRADLRHLGLAPHLPLFVAVSKSSLSSHAKEFNRLRSLRNRVFHGITDLDASTLSDATYRVNRLAEILKQQRS
jgi:ppGpp synthetase/RelA/SpoT-type nucleotidyltranferase